MSHRASTVRLFGAKSGRGNPTLSERGVTSLERKALALWSGAGGGRPLDAAQVAARLKMSRSRVSEIIQTAIAELARLGEGPAVDNVAAWREAVAAHRDFAGRQRTAAGAAA